MKASLVVIASLFVSPAYAFENLIVDSTFQYPVVLTGKVTSWSDVQLTGAIARARTAQRKTRISRCTKFPHCTKFSHGTQFARCTESPR